MNRKLLLLFALTLLVIATGCTTPVPYSPAPVKPTLQATGSFELSSVPSGSEIYLDGVYRGTTPSHIPDVSPGTHTLELRSREYYSWSAAVVVQTGITSYIDAELVPVVTHTFVPTPVPTKPVPKTVAGCWQLEIFDGNKTVTYSYELETPGTGWIWGTRKTPTLTETVGPESVTWSLDPNTEVITILQAYTNDPTKFHTTVMTYDENADILDGGGKGNVPMIFVRVPC